MAQTSDFTPALLLMLVLPLIVLIPLTSYGTSLRSRTAAAIARWRQSYNDASVLIRHLAPVKKEGGAKHIALLVTGAVLCLITGRVLNLVIPVVLRNLVDSLTATDTGFPWTSIVGFILLQHVLLSVTSQCAATIGTVLEAELQDRIQCSAYDKVMSLSAEYHDSPLAASGWHTIVLATHKAAFFIRQVCFDLIPSLLDIFLVASAFSAICGGHMAAIVAVYLACYVSAVVLFRSNHKDEAEAFYEHRRNLISMAWDRTQSWWTVWSFGRTTYEKASFRDAVAVVQSKSLAYNFSRISGQAGSEATIAIGLTFVALTIGHQIRAGERSVGDFVILLRYWSGLTDPVMKIVASMDWMNDFLVESAKLLEILRREPAVQDCKGAIDYQHRGGSISFENVCFSYDGKRQILDNVSFRVEAGKTVAIVGETGGGKSTLLKLLCRAYDASSGCIKIDDQDVKQVRLQSLIGQISIVPQTIGVFDTTILENLKYGNFDATEEDCKEACAGAALHKKISSLPGGYHEAVGRRGVKLSGGELQRLAIARVFLRQSKIVLFDEAMSSMDSETESKIQDHLRTWCVGRTVVIVAHRLATIAHADLIVAVKDGCIVEAGKQAELLTKKGYYYNLWDKQKLV